MSIPSWRHSSLFAASFVLMVGSFFAVFGGQGIAEWSGIFFFGAMVGVVFLALVSRQKWFALVWPLLFVLLGLIFHHGALLFADLVAAGAFSTLFLLVQKESQNFVQFAFFLGVKPALRIFLLLFFLAFAVGIYTGVPPEKIEQKMEQGIQSLNKIPLPGGTELAEFITNLLKKSQESMMGQDFFTSIVEQKIAAECDGNEECAAQIRQALERQAVADTPQDETMVFSAAEMTAGAQSFLETQLSSLSQRLNLSLLTAVAFLLVIIPFSGILASILAFLAYLFFWIARKSRLIRLTTQTVTQQTLY